MRRASAVNGVSPSSRTKDRYRSALHAPLPTEKGRRKVLLEDQFRLEVHASAFSEEGKDQDVKTTVSSSVPINVDQRSRSEGAAGGTAERMLTNNKAGQLKNPQKPKESDERDDSMNFLVEGNASTRMKLLTWRRKEEQVILLGLVTGLHAWLLERERVNQTKKECCINYVAASTSPLKPSCARNAPFSHMNLSTLKRLSSSRTKDRYRTALHAYSPTEKGRRKVIMANQYRLEEMERVAREIEDARLLAEKQRLWDRHRIESKLLQQQNRNLLLWLTDQEQALAEHRAESKRLLAEKSEHVPPLCSSREQTSTSFSSAEVETQLQRLTSSDSEIPNGQTTAQTVANKAVEFSRLVIAVWCVWLGLDSRYRSIAALFTVCLIGIAGIELRLLASISNINPFHKDRSVNSPNQSVFISNNLSVTLAATLMLVFVLTDTVTLILGFSVLIKHLALEFSSNAGENAENTENVSTTTSYLRAVAPFLLVAAMCGVAFYVWDNFELRTAHCLFVATSWGVQMLN